MNIDESLIPREVLDAVASLPDHAPAIMTAYMELLEERQAHSRTEPNVKGICTLLGAKLASLARGLPPKAT